MSEPATDPGGQVLIDGFTLADRKVGLQGLVSVKDDVHDQLRLGSRMRLVLEVDVVSRKDRKLKRDEWGNDNASRVLGISIHKTRSVKIIPVTDDEPAETEAQEPPVEPAGEPVGSEVE